MRRYSGWVDFVRNMDLNLSLSVKLIHCNQNHCHLIYLLPPNIGHVYGTKKKQIRNIRNTQTRQQWNIFVRLCLSVSVLIICSESNFTVHYLKLLMPIAGLDLRRWKWLRLDIILNQAQIFGGKLSEKHEMAAWLMWKLLLCYTLSL